MITIKSYPPSHHPLGVVTISCSCGVVYMARRDDFSVQDISWSGDKKDTTELAVKCPVCSVACPKKGGSTAKMTWGPPFCARYPRLAKILFWKRKKKPKLPKATAKLLEGTK